MKKILATFLAMCVAFTGVMSLGTTTTYAAVKTPAKVTGVKATAASTSAIKVTWKKAKYASGYQVYCGSKKVATTTKLTATIKNLKASTKYSYKVRAYKKYKQYYNSKKKKWVNSKPKKSQWKGKKTRNRYKYGKFSKVVSATTKAAAVAVTWPTMTEADRASVVAAVNQCATERSDETVEYVQSPLLNAYAQAAAEQMAEAKDLEIDPYYNGTYIGDLLTELGLKASGINYHMGENIKTFDYNMVYYQIVAELGPMNTSAYWTPDFSKIGVGYCQGYIAILITKDFEE